MVLPNYDCACKSLTEASDVMDKIVHRCLSSLFELKHGHVLYDTTLGSGSAEVRSTIALIGPARPEIGSAFWNRTH